MAAKTKNVLSTMCWNWTIGLVGFKHQNVLRVQKLLNLVRSQIMYCKFQGYFSEQK